MGEILIGTSSWTDPTLVKDGHFYPREARSAEDRLRYYATQFPLVEVDSTYYYPPSERNATIWIERTPPDFTFNVKAYSLLTGHPTKPDSLLVNGNEHPFSYDEESRLVRIEREGQPAEAVLNYKR